MKLSTKGLALALGVVWGLGQLLMGWAAMWGWGRGYVRVLSSVYVGFKASFIGGIVGGIWAFFYGLIGGALIAFFYNLFAKK